MHFCLIIISPHANPFSLGHLTSYRLSSSPLQRSTYTITICQMVMGSQCHWHHWQPSTTLPMRAIRSSKQVLRSINGRAKKILLWGKGLRNSIRNTWAIADFCRSRNATPSGTPRKFSANQSGNKRGKGKKNAGSKQNT
jgi:hypothetical protein